MAVMLSTPTQAARFLYRSTFGPKDSDIERLLDLGVEKWLEQQFNTPPGFHLNLAREYANRSGTKVSRTPVWWYQALNAEDQLRQRVAFALSQIFVVSRQGGPDDEALLAYYDLLLNHAFGNFRELLEQVTLSPAMGSYLTLIGSKKADPVKNSYPDENYAREVMQLFTIGLWKLRGNGQPKTDQQGELVPSYTQQDVEELARVLTGWRKRDYFNPMYAVANDHDNGAKRVLRKRFPEGQSPEQDLSQAMDVLFKHRNTPVFIATLLIKRLTISNPRRRYITRVAKAFKDNGFGVRGDLKAVIKAILLDPDILKERAMADHQERGRSSHNFGKVKEPLIAMANFARALQVKSNDANRWWDFPGSSSNNFGQSPLGAPSVFNFYEPDYAPKSEIAELELSSPEFNILGMDTFRTISNRMWALIRAHNNTHPRGWHWDRSEFEQTVNDKDQYIELINSRFFAGTLPASLASFLNQLLAQHEYQGHSADRKITDTLFAVQCSPEFRCQE